MDMYSRSSSVEIKGDREISLMREVCQLAAGTLERVGPILRAGITTQEINDFVHADTLRLGGRPAPPNYRGCPKSGWTSINEVVCHGIPTPNRVLKDGDIINVDVTHLYKGFHGDTSATFYIGEPSADAKRVVEVARKSLELGIAQVKPGARLGDIGAAIQEFAERNGCSVVRDFVGHGIGRKFHDEPQVKHYGEWGKGNRLKPGMTFTIEPMVNIGDYEVEVLDDDWTAVTKDGSLSAQFEHTVLVTLDGVEILTQRAATLVNSEQFPNYFSK